MFNVIWVFLATANVTNREYFWSLKHVNIKRGYPYRLNELICRDRLREIIQNLCLTNRDLSSVRDRFWEVRHNGVRSESEHEADIYPRADQLFG